MWIVNQGRDTILRRVKNIISCTLAALMLICTAFNSNLTYAGTIATPTPIVDGLNATYMAGSELALKLTATGTSMLVQYKAVLKNETTGKTIDIINGYTSKYYNPKYSYPLSFKVIDGGKYTLSITSKPGGYKDIYAKTIIRTFSVISDADVITSIAPVTARINIGEAYSLPAKVEAKMKDGSVKNVDVKWDSTEVNTSEIGVKTYLGSVSGYNQKIQLTLNIVDEKIISIDDINIIVDEGSQYALPNKVTAKLKNSTMDVDVTWDKNTLDTSKSGKYTFAGKVQGYDKTVNLTITVNTVDIKLDSVYSTNLKEVTAVFNKRILRNTVRNNNFKLYKDNVQIPVNAELNDDEKTLTLTILSSGTSLNINDKYKLVVEGIKDYNSVLMAKTSIEFTPEDREVPTVKSIYTTSSKNLIIEFSEPIKYTGTGVVEVRNNNNLIPVNNIYSGYDTNLITITFNYPMTVTAKYDVLIKNFQDYAGKACTLKTDVYTFLKDDKQIEAKLRYADETFAIVDFTKFVNGISRYNFTNNASGNFSLAVYKDKEMTIPVTTSDFVKRVWVKFYDRGTKTGYPFTEVEQKLIVTGNYNGNIIKDMWSLLVKDTYFSITVTADKKQPQVVSVEVDSESTLSVKFDEDVNLNLSNIDILDGEGKKIQGLRISQYEEGSFIINLGKSYAGSNIVISIKNVEDMAIKPNKLLTYSKTLFVADKTPPRVEKTVKKFIPGSEQIVYIYFNESLDIQSLGSFGFSLQNPATNIMERLTQKPDFSSRDSIIVIPLTNEERDKINSGYNIFVSNIQDKSKNLLEGQIILNGQITSYNSLDNRPKVEKIEAFNDRKVVVTFNQYLSTVHEAAFLINGSYPENVELSVNDDGNTVVTLTALEGKGFNSDLSSSAALRIATDDNMRVENEFGVNAEAKTYTISTIPAIQDKIPPALKQIKAIASGSGIVDTIVLEYEENIDVTKLSALTYSVDGRDVSRVYTNTSGNRGTSTLGRFVIIELKTTGTVSDNASGILQVTQLLDIYDMHDNKLSPNGEAMLTSDVSAPIVLARLTTQISKGETRTIIFSEDIDSSSKLSVENAIRQASRGKGLLYFNWGNNGILSITNMSTTESTDFILSNRVTLTISDNYGNKTYNAFILGL